MSDRRVVVECPDCGVERVPSVAVVVRSCVETAEFSYRTRCLICDTVFVAPTAGDAALRAVLAGAVMEYWSLPLELLERPDGPPISGDDVKAFAYLLDEPDWFDRLVPHADGR